MPLPSPKSIALLAALALPQTAVAATVYDEAVDGDAFFGDMTEVILALGENRILGSATVSFGGTVPTDFDDYRLIVGPGERIVSIFLTSVVRSEGSGDFLTITWNLGGIASPEISASSVGVAPFAGVLPVGQGSYALATEVYKSSFPDPGYRTADYDFTINVAAVPLPAGLALLAGGLGLLAVAGHRRRA